MRICMLVAVIVVLATAGGCDFDELNEPIYPARPGAEQAAGTSGACEARALHWRKQLISEAQSGDAEAQYKLGLYYYRLRDALTDSTCGPDVQGSEQHLEDRAIALNWFCLAANQGHPDAQFQLGRFYAAGHEPLTRDTVQALKWYSLAAAGGQPLAAIARDDLAEDMMAEQVAETDRLVAGWQPEECVRQLPFAEPFGPAYITE